MNLPLIVNPEAEADLGDECLDGVREVLDLVRRTPHLYPKVFQELRLALVRRFPYAVIYRIDDDQITVVAVYHTRRDPRGWQRRT